MCSILLLAALAQPAPEPAAPSGLAPVHAVASIDSKGKVSIWYAMPGGYGGASHEMPVTAYKMEGDKKVPVTAMVKMTQLMVSGIQLDAQFVTASTADGKAIAPAKLAELLAKERTVLLALDGKKVDPFHLQLYRESTIVLVTPPVGHGHGPIAEYGEPTPVPVAPEAKKELPKPRTEPDPNEK